MTQVVQEASVRDHNYCLERKTDAQSLTLREMVLKNGKKGLKLSKEAEERLSRFNMALPARKVRQTREDARWWPGPFSVLA